MGCSLLLASLVHAQNMAPQSPWRIGDALDKWAVRVESFLNGDWLRGPVQSKLDTSASVQTAIRAEPEPTAAAVRPSSQWDDVEFDTAFLGDQQKIDLSKFSKGDHVQPGVLRVDVRVNDVPALSDAVRFEADAQGHGRPCLNARQLLRTGILISGPVSDQTCYPVLSLVPGAAYAYDAGEQILNLVIPQAYVRTERKGSVDAGLWEKGVPVAHSQYSLLNTQSQLAGVSSQANFGRFDNTVSMGGWQLKNSMTVSQAPQSGWSSQVLNAYLRTDLEQIQGELKLGEIYTSGVLFETFNLKGVSLASYDEFLSDQDVGYAPVVRGVADTQATVTISQNNVQIYKTQVPPGPFVISDLRGAGYSGTLTVTIAEANGQVKTFLTPYSAQAQMVRKGRLKYAFNAGRYNAINSAYRPDVSQLTAQYGLFSNLTTYGGLTVSPRYASQLTGVAMSTFMGTLSLDQTRSSADLDTGLQKGHRQRLSYNKSVEATGMMVNVSRARQASGTYLSLAQAMNTLGHQNASVPYAAQDQWMASLTQPMGVAGDVSVNWVRNVFDASPAADNYGVTWRKSFGGMNLSVSANRQLAGFFNSTQTQAIKSVSVQLSIPLEKMGYVSSGVHFSGGRETSQTTYANTLGEHREYAMSVTASTDAERATTVSASGSVRNRLGYQSIGLSSSAAYRQVSLGMTGGVVLHEGGVTFAPQISDTMAIVHAPGAEGARINGDMGAVIDRRGYAIVPSLQPYRVNEIYLDPRGISEDVELTATSQQAVVRSGAVTRLTYTTVTGRGLVLTLERAAGAVPFGASVSNESGQDLGAVGQGSRVFLRGVPESGRLIVSWGAEANESCVANYTMPPVDKRQPFDHLSVPCRPLSLTTAAVKRKLP